MSVYTSDKEEPEVGDIVFFWRSSNLRDLEGGSKRQ